ncbi:MAG: RNA methyltransferase [Flavobacteriaceae bacterium]
MVDRKLLTYLEGFITPERKERFSKVLEERTKFITVAIEDVFQMHNTSAVIRTCDVFGIQEAHVIEQRFGKRMDKHIAMGAQQWVDIQRYQNTMDCIQMLRKKGYKIIATSPSNEAITMHDFVIDQKMALFFGTEKEGLSETVLREADETLKIPMFGFSESLNISVSAAILLQYIVTQLRKTDLAWHLTDDEKLQKRLDWTMKSVRSVEDILARFHSIN